MAAKNRGLKAIASDPRRVGLGRRLAEMGRRGRMAFFWPWLLPGLVALALAAVLTPQPWLPENWPSLAGLAALAALLLKLLHGAWYRRLDQAPAAGRQRGKDLVFLACLLVFLALLTRAYQLFAGALAAGLPWLHLQALGCGAPLAAGPILASLLLGPQTGMLVALAGGLLASLAWPDSTGIFVCHLLAGVVAAHFVAAGRTRLSLIAAGTHASLAGLAAFTALGLMKGWLFTGDYLAGAVATLAGGLLGGVLAAGLAPLCEIIFRYVTHIRLMELASLDHPALQELMLQAPGTYHHSLVVGSLVEAAAREIGANHRLCKVAALYHDLGKIKKAAYFVENQAGPNRHEKLAPSMSALILTSHVKEGVEMARRFRLGGPIIDIIAQHHGTRVIHFFYMKALDSRRQAGQPDPHRQDFRYPGPRPQTREAGLVMLADTVEAACRSLDNPTPARLQGLVQTQINKIFVEGELDDCELTLKDLHKVAKVFNKMLAGVFHQRVEYPDAPERGKKRHDSSDRPPARGAGPQSGEPANEDTADLKRLGIGA